MKSFGFRPMVLGVALLSVTGFVTAPSLRSMAAQEADALKTTLTPFGALKAANADNSIPAWSGSTPAGGFRDEPFAKEAPILTITSKNAAQYTDKLTEGTKAMLNKYPDFKIVVSPTHRTESAPQWVYDATYANATHGKLNGFVPSGVYSGIPFPLPKSGAEAMWNHLLRWRPSAWQMRIQAIETTTDGRHIMTVDGAADQQMPYYFKGDESHFNGDYWEIRLTDFGPPIRTGEAVVGRQNLNDDHTRSWVYLAGQRRTRELPNACCDTPTPASAGIMTFDELEGFSGRIDRYDWKLDSRKEMYVPYNDNAIDVPSNDLLLPHFMNPDRVRWELHRVWPVHATLRAGQRHQSPRATFYLDEDSWAVLLSDRWDAHDQLWKTGFNLPITLGDANSPAVVVQTFGQYDLQSGSWFVNGLLNQSSDYFKPVAHFADDDFLPQAMLRGAR